MPVQIQAVHSNLFLTREDRKWERLRIITLRIHENCFTKHILELVKELKRLQILDNLCQHINVHSRIDTSFKNLARLQELKEISISYLLRLGLERPRLETFHQQVVRGIKEFLLFINQNSPAGQKEFSHSNKKHAKEQVTQEAGREAGWITVREVLCNRHKTRSWWLVRGKNQLPRRKLLLMCTRTT